MKFQEALKYISLGCKVRAVCWGDRYYTQNKWVDDDFFVKSINLEDIDGEWEKVDEDDDDDCYGYTNACRINLCLHIALEYMAHDYIIRRGSWREGLYLKHGNLYHKKQVLKTASCSILSVDDVLADDWDAYE